MIESMDLTANVITLDNHAWKRISDGFYKCDDYYQVNDYEIEAIGSPYSGMVIVGRVVKHNGDNNVIVPEYACISSNGDKNLMSKIEDLKGTCELYVNCDTPYIGDDNELFILF